MDSNQKKDWPNPIVYHTHSGMVTNLNPLEFSLSAPDKTEFLIKLEASLASTTTRRSHSEKDFRRFLALFNSPN